MIVKGTPQMIPALSKIWAACFGDSPEYIRFFMDKRFPTCQCFVWLEEDEPVGAIYLLPCHLKGAPVLYAYAGGVLPQYRKHGFFGALVDRSAQACMECGASLILVPAPGTEEYYRKRGFQNAFSYSVLDLEEKGEAVPAVFRAAQAQEYTNLRNAHFSHRPYLQWDEGAVQYALEENCLCGGFCEIMTLDREYLLFGRRTEDRVEILETTLNLQTVKRTALTLCRRWGVRQVRILLPADDKQQALPSGSVLGKATFSNGWLGLNLL